MGSHIHQCPVCEHTFVCDYPSCEGKINVKDVRCLLGWDTGLAKLSAMQLGYVDSRFTSRRKGKAHIRALETLPHRPISVPYSESNGALWDVERIG